VEAEKKYRDVIHKIEDLQRIKGTMLNLIDSCTGDVHEDECPILEALEGKSVTRKNQDDSSFNHLLK
jgi:MerR family mercuric resistance operon transcriptional regulator